MMIAIVDYGVGNLTSIQNMLKKGGVNSIISSDKTEIENSEKLILPGMGAFDNCMQKFNDSGLRTSIEKKIFEQKIPVLGICVGLQMFMDSSEEGNAAGLGWIKGRTVAFDKGRMTDTQKVPNMGWLETTKTKDSKLMSALEGARFYFAHSFHVQLDDANDGLLMAGHGYDFTAAAEKNNIVGVQFHPEKSHRFGLQLLKNFAENY